MGRANPAWKKLREYFRRLGSCYSSVEFVHVALVEAREVIPFYDSAGVFDSRDLRCLEGIGNPDACTEAYNDYYRRVMPPPSTYIVDWSRRDDEFAVDFRVEGHGEWPRLCGIVSQVTGLKSKLRDRNGVHSSTNLISTT